MRAFCTTTGHHLRSLLKFICFRMPLAAALIAGSTTLLMGRPRDTGFLNRSVKVMGVTYLYQVYIPRDWTSHRQWPVILFLHGRGEAGDDGILPTQVGIAAAIRRRADRFPAVVVFPQCRKDDWWGSQTMERLAIDALEHSIKEFRGDPARIYLTGISMGSYGAWALASDYPAKFAALVPISGGIRLPKGRPMPPHSHDLGSGPDPYTEIAEKVSHLPIWIFHGMEDPVVPVTESRRMDEALRGLSTKVRYTEYPGMGHNAWDAAYDDPELISWLFAQRR